ncbi:MAG: transposase [Verrucomicrobiota bacterium]
MARKVRVEYEGAVYHLINRGDRREDIFRDDRDRGRFLETLEESWGKTGWQVHAYCLMRNHFHLVVETPRANHCAVCTGYWAPPRRALTGGIEWWGTYFSGRSKSLSVDGSGSGHLKSVCD